MKGMKFLFFMVTFSISSGVPLRSPYGAGARPRPYPELLRRHFMFFMPFMVDHFLVQKIKH
jgi:hypothetical protein